MNRSSRSKLRAPSFRPMIAPPIAQSGSGGWRPKRAERWPTRSCGSSAAESSNSAAPPLDAVERRIGAIDHAVGLGPAMHRQPARGQEGRLRIIGVPVIAARHARLVHQPGQLGRLVAPDARLAGPHREGAATQREIAHLLAPAPDGLAGFGMEAQVQPVVAGQQERDGEDVAAQLKPRGGLAKVREGDGMSDQRPVKRGQFIGGRILDPEVAAHHFHGGIAARHDHRRTGFAVRKDDSARQQQVEPVLDCDKPRFHVARCSSARSVCRSAADTPEPYDTA